MRPAESLPSPRYERNPGSPGIVVLSASALAIGIALVLGVAAWVMRHHDAARPNLLARGNELSFTHGPQQRTGIARAWAAQDATVREHLETYGWNDRPAGIVRIPIERAIEVMSRETANAPRKEAP